MRTRRDPMRKVIYSLTALAGLLLFTSVAAAAGPPRNDNSPNPFNWTGPRFLGFYIALLTCGIGAAILLRRSLRQPSDEPAPEHLALHPYEVAYLAGSTNQVINAVLASLVQSGILTVDATERKLTRRSRLPDGAHELEETVVDAVLPEFGCTIKDASRRIAERMDRPKETLREYGLMPSSGSAAAACLLPLLLNMGC